MRRRLAALLAPACAFLAAGCSIGHAEHGAIETALGSVNRAVLAGDADAYLAHVDRTDPYFAREQAAWAESLKEKAPPEFQVSLNGTVRPEGHTLVAPVRVAWRPEPDEDPREVRFDARFTPIPGDPGAYRYAGPDFEEIADASGRVRVLFPPSMRDEAGRVLDAMLVAVPPVRAFFGFESARVPPIKLYETVGQLQLSISPTYDPPLSGWYEPGESIKKLWRPGRSPDAVERLLAHEYGHALHFIIAEEKDATPWWVREGVAEVAASRVHDRLAGTNERLRRLAAEGKLADFADLAVFDDDTFMDQRLAYPMGHSMVAYLVDRFGKEDVLLWLSAMNGSVSIEGASRAMLGVPFETLDADWRASLQRDGTAGPEPAP